MELTLRAIDSVTTAAEPAPVWTFGGGTSLAIDLGHRVSYDIDAFMDSASIIQRLVPIRNEVTRIICWNSETERSDYQYPGHYLKLNIMGAGEIDFLSASPLLEDATIPYEFAGRIIKRERPAEIIAKKIYYRGSTFKSRDVFDLASTRAAMPEELIVAAASPFLTPDIYARVRLRIEARLKAFESEMREEINPTDFGKDYLENSCSLALEALESMENGPKLSLI
jgi:hypothetical protein